MPGNSVSTQEFTVHFLLTIDQALKIVPEKIAGYTHGQVREVVHYISDELHFFFQVVLPYLPRKFSESSIPLGKKMHGDVRFASDTPPEAEEFLRSEFSKLNLQLPSKSSLTRNRIAAAGTI